MRNKSRDRKPVWQVVRRWPGFSDPDRRTYGVSILKRGDAVASGLTRGQARTMATGLNAAEEVLSS